jgi:hypothetical protein
MVTLVCGCEPLPLLAPWLRVNCPTLRFLNRSPLPLFFPSFAPTHAFTTTQTTWTCRSLLPSGTISWNFDTLTGIVARDLLGAFFSMVIVGWSSQDRNFWWFSSCCQAPPILYWQFHFDTMSQKIIPMNTKFTEHIFFRHLWVGIVNSNLTN